MPFAIVQNDITTMSVDAVVNAANNALQMGGGVCGAIFRAAGTRELQRECDAIGACETGRAVITKGYKLPARHIIHTVGPVWRGGGYGEAALLRECYFRSLHLAKDNSCESVAFPLISSGIFGYPKEEALRVAVAAVREFLSGHDMHVYLVVLDKAAVAVGGPLLGAVRDWTGERGVYGNGEAQADGRRSDAESYMLRERNIPAPSMAPDSPKASKAYSRPFDNMIGRLDDSFARTLFRLIDAKGKTDVEVYKRANIDRKLFSKIRGNEAYMPSKRTAVALAVALELSVDETEDLLRRAGYTLSRSQKFDVIIQHFIANENYDIFEINEALFYFDQPLLGA